MPDLNASDRATAQRTGASTRLLAHRLATFTADQAATAGPSFRAAWRARHGEAASQPKPAAAVTKPAAPVASAPKPPPPVTPPAITAELQAALDRRNAEIARVAAEVEAQRKAAQEHASRRAASDAVWTRAYDPSLKTGPAVPPPANARQAASDDVWAKAHAKLQTTRAHMSGGSKR